MGILRVTQMDDHPTQTDTAQTILTQIGRTAPTPLAIIDRLWTE